MESENMNMPVQIVADIGGTNARFAYVHADNDELLGVEIFPCADFPFFIDAILAYMERGHVEQVNKICLAVAGPVESDVIDLPNNHWSFSRSELQTSLAVSVTIINDFSAQVLCVDSLSGLELQWIGAARPTGGQVKAVVGRLGNFFLAPEVAPLLGEATHHLGVGELHEGLRPVPLRVAFLEQRLDSRFVLRANVAIDHLKCLGVARSRE